MTGRDGTTHEKSDRNGHPEMPVGCCRYRSVDVIRALDRQRHFAPNGERHPPQQKCEIVQRITHIRRRRSNGRSTQYTVRSQLNK